jgi:hypothetical protein
MASALTAGFDFAGEISQEAIEEVIKGYHGSGTIPSLVTESYASPQGPAMMEIYFGPPKLEIISQGGLSNPVRIDFPFVLRLSYNDQEYQGSATVVVSTAKESVIVGSEEAVVITIDFSGLGDDLFEFSLHPWTEAFPTEFDSDIKPVIINSLRAVSTELQISPALVHGNGFFTAQSYIKPDKDSFVGVFVNESNVEMSAPENMDRFGGSDGGLAIPADTVNASIKQNLKDMGLDSDSLPSPMPGDSDLTVYALCIQLRDGHLRVTGDVDDIEFSANLGLKISGGTVTTIVHKVDFDLPWYLDFLDAFGGAITRAMEEELPKALSGLSQAMSGLDLFASNLPNPNLPGNPVTINVSVGGLVSIRSSGIVIPIGINPQFDAVPIELPTYIKGNRETKEFHLSTTCIYGKKLSWKKTQYLPGLVPAIRQGYNGCWTCAREYSHPAGRIIFTVQSTGNAPDTEIAREIGIVGKLVDPLFIDGVEVTDPPFESRKTYVKKSDGNGIWEISVTSMSNLVQPGNWEFTVTSENWTAVCEFNVKPTAQNYGSTNYVSFSMGSPEGNFSYDAAPPFP